MTNFARAREIFHAACRLPPDQRSAFVRERCGNDDALHAEVRSLLEYDIDTVDDARTIIDDRQTRPDAPPVDRIGPYRILHEIGRGGMGVVYAAERDDDELTRRVALKVLQRDTHPSVNTEEYVRRFELERQLLSALNHPNIARLYDGGRTGEGQPFFVMEYVDGQPIDVYCDQHRLRIAERITLFQSVCAAVHHAHQNLVVHRDIKPGNILVTADGVPKLLDFGIAKLINPDLALRIAPTTAPELRVMTPEYASPEQVRGGPISTASDIYSLGVLLYELMSGHPPYRLKSRLRQELERVVCEEDPERPSTAVTRIDASDPPSMTPESVSRAREGAPSRLQRRLRGDIDNIVLMAMRKEPRRRYQSAEQFAEDLGRHLRGLPVLARRDTVTYRVHKFVGRNRSLVAAGVLVFLALAAGIAVATLGWRDATHARDETRTVLGELVRSATMRDTLHDAIKKLDDTTAERLALAEEYRAMIAGLRNFDDSLATRLAEIDASLMVGDALGSSREGGMGDSSASLETYRATLQLVDAARREHPKDTDLAAAAAVTHLKIGDVLLAQSTVEAALAEYNDALALIGTVDTSDRRNRRRLAIMLGSIGKTLIKAGRIEEGERHYERALHLHTLVHRDDPSDLLALRSLTGMLVRLGFRHEERGNLARAAAMYEQARDLDERAAQVEAAQLERRETWAQRHLAITLTHCARVERKLGNVAEAVTLLEAARDAFARRLEDEPLNVIARRDLTMGLIELGDGYAEIEDHARADTTSRDAVAYAAALVSHDPADTRYRSLEAAARSGYAKALAAQDRLDQALAEYQGAESIIDALAVADPGNFNHAERRADVRRRMASVLHGLDRTDDARRRYEQARDELQRLHDLAPSQAAVTAALAETIAALEVLQPSVGD